MKWQKDLVKDIRYHTSWDHCDDDPRFSSVYYGQWNEVTEIDRCVLEERFLRVRDYCSAILEIGVDRNQENSFTHVFLRNKKKETVYIGLDVECKDHLIDESNNVYMINGDSSDYHENIKKINNIFEKANLQRKEFDFIFIDGWHSIKQCLQDWEYTNLLGKNGIVGFHDTAYHPGPKVFIRNLNKEKWVVEANVIETDQDWGIGFVWEREHNTWCQAGEGYEWDIDPPNMF